MKKLALLALCCLTCALGASSAAPRAFAAAPQTRVNLFGCTNGTTRTVPTGNDVLLVTGWVASTPKRAFFGVLDSDFRVSVNGVPVRHIYSFYAPINEPVPGQYQSFWTDNIGPISAPTTISVSYSFYFPIIDGLTFNPDGSPHVFSGTQFAGSCTLLPG